MRGRPRIVDTRLGVQEDAFKTAMEEFRSIVGTDAEKVRGAILIYLHFCSNKRRKDKRVAYLLQNYGDIE